MTRVFIHPLAGVLSAYGMGLADVTAMREQAVEVKLEQNGLGALEGALETSSPARRATSCCARACRRSASAWCGACTCATTAPTRRWWSDSAPSRTCRRSSRPPYRKRYSFLMPGRALIAEAVSVEAIGVSDAPAEGAPAPKRRAAAAREPAEFVTMVTGRRAQHAPVYLRERLSPGDRVAGPAIIAEQNATTVVEPGWQAEVTRLDHLVLERVEARPQRTAIGTSVDPVMLEIFNNLYMSIAEQMGLRLANTAYSVNIKERLDFSCAVFDQQGQLIANAPHMPVHLGSMGESVRTVIRENAGRMKPGDVYVLNAPYNGGTHLPDVTVITPVFDDAGGEILFYVGSRGHHADIGGITPGSMPPDSRVVEEEGVLIDNFLLVEEGRLREDETVALLGSGKYPARNIEQNMADLRAMIAANEKGVQELRRMVAHFGLDVVHAYMRHVQDNAEEAVRRVIDVLKDGEFSYEMDHGGTIRVKISIDRKGAARRSTSPAPRRSCRTTSTPPAAVCMAAVLYVFRTLVDDDIPLNAGCLKPLKVVIPEGSMLRPRYPAAVVAGNVETSQCITDALYGALGVMARLRAR